MLSFQVIYRVFETIFVSGNLNGLKIPGRFSVYHLVFNANTAGTKLFISSLITLVMSHCLKMFSLFLETNIQFISGDFGQKTQSLSN